MQSFHHKTRNMVRKAEKRGVEVVVDNEAMTFLMDVHQQNMREIGGLAGPAIFCCFASILSPRAGLPYLCGQIGRGDDCGNPSIFL